MGIPTKVMGTIQDLMDKAGIKEDENIMLHNLSLTNVPQDDFLTRVYVRRAKSEAEGIPETYRCFVCGKPIDDRDEFVEHYQDHLVEFLGGEYPDMSEEEIEYRVKNIPEEGKEKAREILRKKRM